MKLRLLQPEDVPSLSLFRIAFLVGSVRAHMACMPIMFILAALKGHTLLAIVAALTIAWSIFMITHPVWPALKDELNAVYSKEE